MLVAAGLAASDEDFYQRLYQRGMTHFAAADYPAAFTELRNAAFGLVDKVDQFETAQSYACLAARRLGHDSDARDSLMRIVSAEKVQPHFRAIKLPADVRAEVAAVAARLLTEQEAALLGVTAAIRPDVPTPTARPNVALTAPRNGLPDAPGSAGVPPADAARHAIQPADKMPALPATAPKKPIPQPAAPMPQPVIATPRPPSPSPPPTPKPAARSVGADLADAQRAIDDGDIAGARSIYNALSSAPSLPHDAALRVAEGLYRVRDFPGAERTFARAGAIGRGEEHYHYYYAVTLYEIGRYGNAKRELAAALPYLDVTPDVTRYRAKIEGAIE